METIKINILEAAGNIINEAGINALSLDALSLKLGIPRNKLLLYIRKDEDIVICLLLSLESEMLQLINNVAAMSSSSENEFQNLFKSLFKLFNQKLYYLHLMFSTEIIEKNAAAKEILKRILKIAKTYLTQVLEKGKKTGVFSKKITTNLLVENILGSFRLLMSDQQLTNKMIRDLKILRADRE